MSANDESTPLVDELLDRTRALKTLLHKAAKVAPEVAEPLDAAARELDRRLARNEARAALIGSSAETCGELLDRIVGERVFASKRPSGAKIFLRSGVTHAFRATWRGGLVEELGVPDRRESFVKAVARAEQERLAAEKAAKAIDDRLSEIDEALGLIGSVPSKPPEPLAPPAVEGTLDAPAGGVGERLRTIWLWFLHLFGVLRLLPSPSKSVPPRVDPDTAAAAVPPLADPSALHAEREPLVQKRGEAEERVKGAIARLRALRQERDDYAAARRRAFIDDLRALTDGGPRGAEISELSIELPSEHLPPGFSIVEARDLLATDPADAARARSALGPDLDAIIAATAEEAETPAVKALLDALAPIPLYVPPGAASADELTTMFDRIRQARPFSQAERAVALTSDALKRAIDGTGGVVTIVRERITALEAQRIPDPPAYRARLLERVGVPIEDTSRSMERDAIVLLQTGMKEIKEEWKATIEACIDRAAVEAAIATINERAAARLHVVVEDMQKVVLTAMQWASDTMKLELVEELELRYEIVRRASVVDGAAVVSTVTAEDYARLESPLTGAMSAFEDKRVGLGIGGAAAGALLGTLIVPGIGTAIGAFLGTFAGFLRGLDSLKRECMAKLEACLDQVAAQIAAQLERRHGEFVDGIRRALDEALELSLERFERATARLVDVERGVLEREGRRLDELLSLAAAIDRHAARIRELGKGRA